VGQLEREFKTRFPNVKKATKTAPELERELGAMRMSTEELGKTEKYRGEEVYTHMMFAEKILDLAKRAKIETSTSGFWKVRDELPEILREKIPENQASWTQFVQAIKDVDMGHIREGVRKYKEKTASEAQVKADINFLKQQRTANATVGSTELAHQSNPNPTSEHRHIPTTSQPRGTRRPIWRSKRWRRQPIQHQTPRPPATEAEKATLRPA
jgi:hypothetical protein